MKTDYWSYVKLIGGIFMTFPLAWAFFALDFPKETAFYIALGMYVAMIILAIICFNYLETGDITKSAKSNYEKTI